MKMSIQHRNIRQVPVYFLWLFFIFFAGQVFYHHSYRESSGVAYKQLKAPLESGYYKAISFGSDKLLSFLLLMGVQLHDNQKGMHVSYRHLDYAVLSDWLLTIEKINPNSDYPAFLASRVYSHVDDKAKIRLMVDVIEKLFKKNPQKHWRRMTEACLLLKHQLNDLPAALKVAEQIADLPKGIKLPFWARDMKLVLLDELSQFESAQLLISSMLKSGEITDKDELRFLQARLLKIQQVLSKN